MWFVLQPVSLHSFTCTKIRTNNKMVKIITTILIGITIIWKTRRWYNKMFVIKSFEVKIYNKKNNDSSIHHMENIEQINNQDNMQEKKIATTITR